jgi:hypothetical protein
MRSTLFALLAAALLLAGCSSKSPSPATTAPAAHGMGNATAIAPLHFGGSFTAGADPFNFLPATPAGGANPCSTSASTCYKHDFTVPAGTINASMEAKLMWTQAANDLDLYLYQGDTQLSMDGINQFPPSGAPSPGQDMHVTGLAAGSYTFWVVVWAGAADSYTLDATFS